MPQTLDRDGSTPLYIQLANILREKIEGGEWAVNHKIPSENELNQTYGISRMTARQVLAQLANEGLIFRVQGKGTFVAPRKISTRSPAYKGIREQLEQMGYATSTQLLGMELGTPPSNVARTLGLPSGAHAYTVRRLRLVEDEPISLHTSYIPQALAEDLDRHDPAERQLCAILEDAYGLRMDHVVETLETTTPSAADARVLGVGRTAPLLLLTQQISTATGTPFEHSRILFRGDKIRLEFHYDL
ncbi:MULTISPECIES: GntR family transcriptional regulator [Cellulosimicrobium]|uniref:GntR family transcriptional regulator n=1 Tax=Cellulosimicrobium sp. ES-005 TaxID=3163031 RepID=A0AAU8G4E2_9MICO|nr:GntR family transcriptional regulator [Cellulosimicrobium cellulans]MCO7274460.1 GntR family transcriptional regulator [Cellulosimicrobium cellulans]